MIKKPKVKARSRATTPRPSEPTFTLIAEEGKYQPIQDPVRKSVFIRAKIKTAMNTLAGTTIQIPHRHSLTMDTGVKAEIPDGYRLSVRIAPKLVQHGLSAPPQVNSLYSSGDIKVWLTNVGRELVIVNDGDILAECRLEAVPNVIVEIRTTGGI